MINIDPDAPNPMLRVIAVTLDHAFFEGKDERLSDKDAALAAGLMLLPVTAPVKIAGGELITKGAEALVAHGLQKVRKGFAEVAMIAIIIESPLFIILLWKYGVYHSVWDGVLSLAAKFF